MGKPFPAQQPFNYPKYQHVFSDGACGTWLLLHFFSLGCFSVVAILTILPVTLINRLWFYLFNLLIEFVGIYFLIASIIYWVNTDA